MKCTTCGNEMTEQSVRFCSCDANPPIIIENTPALVCEVCGTKWYPDSTVEIFEKIRDNLREYAHPRLMYVVDFSSAKASHSVPLTTSYTYIGTLSGVTIAASSPGRLTPIAAGFGNVAKG